MKVTVLWDATPCSLVRINVSEVYAVPIFRARPKRQYLSVKLHVITAQKAVVCVRAAPARKELEMTSY
jgi:hypothetical protein